MPVAVSHASGIPHSAVQSSTPAHAGRQSPAGALAVAE
jgi:hypothetical protein